MSGSSELGNLLRRLEPVRRNLSTHRLYGFLDRRENVAAFMEHHVYAVWDCMALLKAMQRHLTCIDVNWHPSGSAAIRRLVNEIVLEEESDEVDGVATSQFELYRRAMRRAGAASDKIDCFIAEIEEGNPIEIATARCGVPAGAVALMRTTQGAIATCEPHIIVAAFALGWEDIVGSLFDPILARIPASEELEMFGYFLRRRIERNRRGRGAMAIAMLSQLCDGSATRWREAGLAGAEALAARLAFWNAIASALECTAKNADVAVSAVSL